MNFSIIDIVYNVVILLDLIAIGLILFKFESEALTSIAVLFAAFLWIVNLLNGTIDSKWVESFVLYFTDTYQSVRAIIFYIVSSTVSVLYIKRMMNKESKQDLFKIIKGSLILSFVIVIIGGLKTLFIYSLSEPLLINTPADRAVFNVFRLILIPCFYLFIVLISNKKINMKAFKISLIAIISMFLYGMIYLRATNIDFFAKDYRNFIPSIMRNVYLFYLTYIFLDFKSIKNDKMKNSIIFAVIILLTFNVVFSKIYFDVLAPIIKSKELLETIPGVVLGVLVGSFITYTRVKIRDSAKKAMSIYEK